MTVPGHAANSAATRGHMARSGRNRSADNAPGTAGTPREVSCANGSGPAAVKPNRAAVANDAIDGLDASRSRGAPGPGAPQPERQIPTGGVGIQQHPLTGPHQSQRGRQGARPR